MILTKNINDGVVHLIWTGVHNTTLKLIFGAKRQKLLSLIYPPYRLNPVQGYRGRSLSQLWGWMRGGVTPWTGHQSITGPHRDKQPHLWSMLDSSINLRCFGWREETWAHRENPHINVENMHTPHRKAPAGKPNRNQNLTVRRNYYIYILFILYDIIWYYLILYYSSYIYLWPLLFPLMKLIKHVY